MRALLLAATALALFCGSTYAQTSNSGSSSTTTVNTSSGSQSSSASNPTVNVIGNPIGNGASSSTSGSKSSSSSRSNSRSAAVGNVTNVYTGSSGSGGVIGGGSTAAGDPTTTTATTTTTAAGGGDPTVNMNYSGSYTVRNTPEVIPPNVMGGNPCAVGASGGMSTPGFGLAMGATWADRACERRQQAALLFNMGEQKVALELMCQDDNIRTAMKVAARPCTTDIPAPAPVAQAAAPTVIAVAASAPAKPVAIAAALPAAPKPAWCLRAKPDTEASKLYVAQVCGR